MKPFWSIFAVILSAAVTPAAAAISVLGGGQAQECFQATEAGKFDNSAVSTCTAALDTEVLDVKDRGGTLVNRGVMHLRRGEYDAAKADLDAGVAAIPEVGEGWINRGALLICQHRFKEALSDIDRALQLGLREPAKAYFNRAVAYEGLDDETSAYRDYQQALVLAPDWALPAHELLRFKVTRR